MNNTKTGISPKLQNESHTGGLRSGFTPLNMWAFSIGTSIGWGSFIVTCNTYLQKSGLLGTIFGLLAGMAVIFVITWNLQYMIGKIPDCGPLKFDDVCVFRRTKAEE